MYTVLKKVLATSASLFLSFIGVVLTEVEANAVEPVIPNTYQCASTYFPQADDASFQMTLPFELKLGQTNYNQIYVSTNGVMSFGIQDATFSDYPMTPSISLAGYDWVTWGDGGYLRYGTTENTLCIQWAVRPYPQSTGPVTNITLLVNLLNSGGWTGEIITDGWLPANLRRGIRYQSSEPVVVIDSTFRVGSEGVPVETQTCWDGSVIPVTSTCPAVPEPVLMTREVQCSWTNPYTQEVVYGSGQQQYYLYWDNSTLDIQTVTQACALVTPPTFTPPDPTVQERNVQCSWTNPYTQEILNGLASQKYFLYWDGSTTDIDTTEKVCFDATPTFPTPLPVIKEKSETCSWVNPYTQEVVTKDVTQKYYLYWNGTTEDIDNLTNLCGEVEPIFIEPEPTLQERSVECIWKNPYTLEYVNGTAVSQYNLYWNGNEVYVVSPVEACAIATPIFVPVEYPSEAIYLTANENQQINYVAPKGMKIKEILFASYGTSENYQYGPCHAENSLSKVIDSISNNTLNISANNGIFGDPCGGTYKKLSIVLLIEVDPNYVPPTYTCWDGSIVLDLFLCPVEPTPTPTPSPSISISPTPSPSISPSPTPEPSKSPTKSPEPEPTIEPSIDPTQESSPEPSLEVSSSPEPTPSVVPTKDSNPTPPQEEPQPTVDSLVSEYADTSIPFEVFQSSGLDYSDLPPDQPVTLENGVVITAKVADALEIFKSPSEIFSAVFTNPIKAFTALANIGADMSPKVRESAQKVTIVSVIVGQVIASTTALTILRR